jgi:hypothetical protein
VSQTLAAMFMASGLQPVILLKKDNNQKAPMSNF